MAKHHLVVIGCMSTKRAYLDMTREEALARYRAEEDDVFTGDGYITEFDFTDTFAVYDAWATEDVE